MILIREFLNKEHRLVPPDQSGCYQNFEVIGSGSSCVVYRKTLILLSFYNFYADLYCAEDLWHSEDPVDVREHLQEFRDELDLQLDDCGYAQVYPRNPFDWFILNCAADPDPLRRFRDHIADFLLF